MRLKNEALLDTVRDHLLADIRLAGQCIDVTASEGYIVLVGCVDTQEQKELAMELAEGISGVRSVENHILVRKQVSR